MASEPVPSDVFTKAVDEALVRLTPRRREQMLQKLKASGIHSFEEMTTVLATGSAAIFNESTNAWLDKLLPVFNSLKLLSKVGEIMTEAKCDAGLPIVAVCWLLSEAYQSFKGARDGIDLFLEQLKIEIPHLNFLQGTVDIRSPDFVMNLAAYYKELVGFFLDCIEFLEHSRLRQAFDVFWSNFKAKADARLPRLKDIMAKLSKTVHLAVGLESRDLQRITAHNLHRLVELKMNPDHVWRPVKTSHNPPNPQFFHTPDYQKLCDQVNQKPTTDVTVLPICGMEGTGKSAMVRQLIAESSSLWDFVAWIDSSSPENLQQSYRKQAISSRAVLVVDENRLAVQSVCDDFKAQLFNANPLFKTPGQLGIRWLLIFDDVKDVKDAEAYFPFGCLGTIIVTTRETDDLAASRLSRNAQPIFLKPLCHDNSIRLLRHRVKTSGVFSTQVELEAVTKIAAASHGFMTCLEVLASAVEVKGSFKLYLDRNKNWLQSIHAGPSAIFVSSFKTLKPADLLLLQTISFMHLDSVPLAAFSRIGRGARSADHEDIYINVKGQERDYRPSRVFPAMCEYPGVEDNSGSEIPDSVARLQSAGLLEMHRSFQDEVQSHEMVANHLLSSMDAKTLQLAFDRAVLCLNSHLPEASPLVYHTDLWPQFELYTKQVQAMLRSYDQLENKLTNAPVYLCVLLRRFVRYLFETAQYAESRRLSDIAIAILDQALTSNNHPTHPVQSVVTLRVRFLANLGHIYQTLGYNSFGVNEHSAEYACCISYKQSEMVQRAYEAKQSLVLSLVSKGDYDLALTKSDVCSMAAPPPAFSIAHDMITLGLCYRLAGKLAEATQSINTARQRFGSGEFATAPSTKVSLSLCDFQDGSIEYSHGLQNSSASGYRFDKAYGLVKKTADCFKEVAKGHPETAFVLHKLAMIQVARKKDIEASEHLIMAIKILTASEAHHVSYIRSAALLSEIFERLGDKVSADAYALRCQQKKADILADKQLMSELAYELPKTFEAKLWKDLVTVDFR